MIRASRAVGNTVTIPDSVTAIETDAFDGCDGLERIEVAAENPNYSSRDGILYNKGQTELLYVPRAIAGAVEVPEGVTAIGAEAFLNCSRLTALTLPQSLTAIGERAFGDCTGLTTIRYSGTMEAWKRVMKSDLWREGSAIRQIVCTNGTLTEDVTAQ